MLERTKEFTKSFLDGGAAGFDVAIYKSGECILRHRMGYNDIENKIEMKGNERHYIYSCSKPITCCAALQLLEKGLYSLEDKLSDYMPEFKEMTVSTPEGIKKSKKPILIKHLFEMTAGFSYDIYTPQLEKCREETGGRCPTRETMKYLAREPLLFEPGEGWNYSLCHDVLAAFVEVISGEKFEDYTKKHIFDVVGMKDSTFLLPDNELDTLSKQYKYDYDKREPFDMGKGLCYKLGSEYASGGAGCVSTVDDYIKFLEGVRTDVLLKSETRKLWQTDRLTGKARENYFSDITRTNHGYGLGIRCRREDGGRYVDYGWGGAAGAWLALDDENEFSMYVGIHTLAAPVQGLRSVLYRFMMADLSNDTEEFERIKDYLKNLMNYNLTY